MKVNQSKKIISFSLIALIVLIKFGGFLLGHNVVMDAIIDSAQDNNFESIKSLTKNMITLKDNHFLRASTWVVLITLMIPFFSALIAGYLRTSSLRKTFGSFIGYLKSKEFWLLTVQFTYPVLVIARIIDFIISKIFLAYVSNSFSIFHIGNFDSIEFAAFVYLIIRSITVTALVLYTTYITVLSLYTNKSLKELITNTSLYEYLCLMGTSLFSLIFYLSGCFVFGLLIGLFIDAGAIQSNEIFDFVLYLIVIIVLMIDLTLLVYYTVSLVVISSLAYNRAHNKLTKRQSYFTLLKSGVDTKFKLVGLLIVEAICSFIGFLSLSIGLSSSGAIGIIIGLVLALVMLILVVVLYKIIINAYCSQYTDTKITTIGALKKGLFVITMMIPLLIIGSIIGLIIYLSFFLVKIYLVKLLCLIGSIIMILVFYIYQKTLQIVVVESIVNSKLGYFACFKCFAKAVATNFKSLVLLISKTTLINGVVMMIGILIWSKLLVQEWYFLLMLVSILMIIGYNYVRVNSAQYLLTKFIDQK